MVEAVICKRAANRSVSKWFFSSSAGRSGNRAPMRPKGEGRKTRGMVRTTGWTKGRKGGERGERGSGKREGCRKGGRDTRTNGGTEEGRAEKGRGGGREGEREGGRKRARDGWMEGGSERECA
jgi:hypothetical protein